MDWITEKSTGSFRKMIEAGKLAKEGKESIGEKIEIGRFCRFQIAQNASSCGLN